MSQETPVSTTETRVKNKHRISPFWSLPFITLMVASQPIRDSYQDRDNTVIIDLMSADGIVPDYMPVRYQGAGVGTIQDISLSDDFRKIEVKVNIKSDMKDALREKTQFWLVAPKASLADVSGLDAFVGGDYIGMVPSKGKEQDHFVALDTQSKYQLDNGDLTTHLQAPDFGSLNSGSLVYSHKIPVGKVYDHAINPNKQGMVVDVLIEQRFIDLMKKGSRFWDVSGVDANVSISDAKVKLESLAALANGTIALDSPEKSRPAEAEDTSGPYKDLAYSQRGIIIRLELPSGAGLTVDSTPLMYQGLEAGQLTRLDLSPDGKAIGETTADPSAVTLPRENIRIELRNPRLSFSDANFSVLLTSKIFELVSGDGEPRKEFVVVPDEKAPLHEPDVLTLTLIASESHGTDAGQLLVLHGMQVDQIIDRKLASEGVTFTVAVEPQHRELVKDDDKFVVNNRVGVKVGLDGARFLGVSVPEWINGGICILPGDKSEMKANYPLYTNLEKALENSLSDSPATTMSLSAETLPDVQAESVVLHREFEVGEVITVCSRASAFDTDLHIKSKYHNLLTNNSVFWAEGGAKVQLNGSGLTVQASPLSKALKGATSFDNLSGASASQRKGDRRILYASETAACAVGGQVALRTFDAGRLAVGMPVRYLGIDIGQIQTLDLITARNEVQAEAVPYPEHVQTFARGSTRFSVATLQISVADAEYLDTIFQPYINVEPDRGNPRRDFELQEVTITDPRCLDGLSIIVEAPRAGSLGIGTPVLFRGPEADAVTGTTLETLPDHVVVATRISKRYQHLARNNSVSRLAPDYSLDSGLMGGVVKTDALNQFIRGGIASATPPDTSLAPGAQEGKYFLLQESEPKE